MDNFKVLNKNEKEITSDEILHPGYIIAMEIEARNLKKSEFAGLLNVKPGHLSELLHQKRHVSAALALRLEQILGIDAEFWLRVQIGYDIAKERLKTNLAA